MHPIKCLIIEDEIYAIKILEKYINAHAALELVAIANDIDMAEEIVRTNAIDLFFLDIHLPEKSGLDFAKTIYKNSSIIFTTAYHQYAIQGYDYNAIDYLLKPISEERFCSAIDKVVDYIAFKNSKQGESTIKSDFMFVKYNGVYTKVQHNEILYIEALHNYVSIITHTQKLIIYTSITKLAKELPESIFVKIHRSYIVNKNNVHSYNSNTVVINNTSLPISRGNKDNIHVQLKQ